MLTLWHQTFLMNASSSAWYIQRQRSARLISYWIARETDALSILSVTVYAKTSLEIICFWEECLAWLTLHVNDRRPVSLLADDSLNPISWRQRGSCKSWLSAMQQWWCKYCLEMPWCLCVESHALLQISAQTSPLAKPRVCKAAKLRLKKFIHGNIRLSLSPNVCSVLQYFHTEP